jgi:uncharacterized membrane protein YkvA (DUF1232 family)
MKSVFGSEERRRRRAQRHERRLEKLRRRREPALSSRFASRVVDEDDIRRKTADDLARAQALTPAEVAAQQQRVEIRFFTYFFKVLARLNYDFALNLVALYYAMLDPDTPIQARGAMVFVLLYFINPFDLVPDVIAAIGFADDAAVLAAAWAIVQGSVKPRHLEAAARRLGGQPS